MISFLFTCLVSTATCRTCSASASGLLLFTVLQQCCISLIMYRLLSNSSWLQANVLAYVHMHLWHMVDAVWHGHCHGFWVPSEMLKNTVATYSFVFNNGVTYEISVEGHRVHHKCCDTPSDSTAAFFMHVPVITQYVRMQLKRVSVWKGSLMLLLHTACLAGIWQYGSDVGQTVTYLVCTTAAFGRTSTLWPAHYSRRRQPTTDCGILRPCDRTWTENACIMSLSPFNFDHAMHHKRQQFLEVDPRKGFDGHALYLAIITLFGGASLLSVKGCIPYGFHRVYFPALAHECAACVHRVTAWLYTCTSLSSWSSYATK